MAESNPAHTKTKSGQNYQKQLYAWTKHFIDHLPLGRKKVIFGMAHLICNWQKNVTEDWQIVTIFHAHLKYHDEVFSVKE